MYRISIFVLLSVFIINKRRSVTALQCSTTLGPIECNHFYNAYLNESSCAIVWSYDAPEYLTKTFQLPPMDEACFSKSDFTNAFLIDDYEFDAKCFKQKYLPLSGFCFCKTDDFCNEKLLNDSTKLNDLISKIL